MQSYEVKHNFRFKQNVTEEQLHAALDELEGITSVLMKKNGKIILVLDILKTGWSIIENRFELFGLQTNVKKTRRNFWLFKEKNLRDNLKAPAPVDCCHPDEILKKTKK